FVTLLAAFVLREFVGVHRWGAVIVGFIGVMVMVVPGVFTFWRPGALSDLGFDMGGVVALTSAFTLAAAIVMVKFLSGELPPVALLIYANVFSTIILAPFLFFYWVSLPLEVWGLIAVMSLVGFVSQYCYIAAMSLGDASFLSPIDYLRLPMSAAADFAVFRLIPGLNVLFGAMIIIISTLYIGWRERQRRKP
ncbi:MAG: DMT family transporter, partial [Henriciella sp.]|nr:DMT family transporter [Henriciella sp.]